MALSNNFLVDYLITQVQYTALVPNSQSQFQSPQILAFLNNEMRLNVSSFIKSVQEEYFVTSLQYPVQAGNSYTIPTRCMGGALRQIVLVDSSGNWVDITKMALEDIVITSYTFFTLPIWNYGYYMMNDKAFLFPQQNTNSMTAYTLQINYERQPNELMLSTGCGQITAINTGTKQVTVNFVDPSWTTSTTFDVINNLPQFSSIQDDQVVTNINGNVLTFSALPTGLAVGQWVCPAGMSCIPQIPYALFPILVLRAAIRIGVALGDSQLVSTLKDDLAKAEEMALKIMTPRVENDQKIIVNRNKAFTGYTWGLPYSR
jgi:hypothetical protein